MKEYTLKDLMLYLIGTTQTLMENEGKKKKPTVINAKGRKILAFQMLYAMLSILISMHKDIVDGKYQNVTYFVDMDKINSELNEMLKPLNNENNEPTNN